MSVGEDEADGAKEGGVIPAVKTVSAPAGVILAIPSRIPSLEGNHRLPSASAAIPACEAEIGVETGYDVTTPAVVILATAWLPTNHRLPSGPATMPFGKRGRDRRPTAGTRRC